MCRDRVVSSRQPTSGVIPSPETVFGNGRDLDTSRTTNPPHGRSSASFLDPIATGFKQEARTSTSEIIYAGDVDNRKPNPSYSVGVPSPPERSTRMLSRSRDFDLASVSSPKYFETLEDMYGEVSEPLATPITNVVSRLTRPTETTPDSTPGGPRCGMGLSGDLTAQDIDTLLGAVPVPFDFSLSHHHLPSRENCENDGQSEEKSLWWHHPIFEARAKADIRRTLSALLPSDPSQDPSPSDMGSWRAEVRPRRSGAQIWAERLEDAFGPGPLNRGLGRKPCRVVGEYPSIPKSDDIAVQDHDVIQGKGLADGVRRRFVPCDSCVRRGRSCVGKGGRACLPCKKRRIACSHVAKLRNDIIVGTPESDRQVPDTRILHSTSKQPRSSRPDVHPSGSSRKHVRFDRIRGEGESSRCDEEIMGAARVVRKSIGWERGRRQKTTRVDCPLRTVVESWTGYGHLRKMRGILWVRCLLSKHTFCIDCICM